MSDAQTSNSLGAQEEQKKTQLLQAQKQYVASPFHTCSLPMCSSSLHGTWSIRTISRYCVLSPPHPLIPPPRPLSLSRSLPLSLIRIMEEEAQRNAQIEKWRTARAVYEAQRAHPDLKAPLKPEIACKEAADLAVAAAAAAEAAVVNADAKIKVALEVEEKKKAEAEAGNATQEVLVTEKEFIELAKRPPRPRW